MTMNDPATPADWDFEDRESGVPPSVELRPCFVWTCDACGVDNVHHLALMVTPGDYVVDNTPESVKCRQCGAEYLTTIDDSNSQLVVLIAGSDGDSDGDGDCWSDGDSDCGSDGDSDFDADFDDDDEIED